MSSDDLFPVEPPKVLIPRNAAYDKAVSSAAVRNILVASKQTKSVDALKTQSKPVFDANILEPKDQKNCTIHILRTTILVPWRVYPDYLIQLDEPPETMPSQSSEPSKSLVRRRESDTSDLPAKRFK